MEPASTTTRSQSPSRSHWDARPGPHRRAAPPTESELFVRYHRDGDLAARAELAERFMPLARDVALRYRYTGEPVDDLSQVAFVGLLKAIDRFDPTRGSRFTSYAVPTVLGELKRYFRDKGWAVRVPREMQERALALSRESESLSQALGRSPSLRELSEELGWGMEEVLEAREAARCYETTSLEAPAHSRADEAASLTDMLGRDDLRYELVELSDVVGGAWQGLPERERKVLQLRFVEDLTQREIGDRIGISQMHVSRLLRRALGRLEAAATEEP